MLQQTFYSKGELSCQLQTKNYQTEKEKLQ